jgi:flagellar biosynthetic protein FlhB
MSGGQEKTEKATPKRMKQLRKDGALERSQDLSAWLGIGVAGLVLPMAIAAGTRAGATQMNLVREAVANPDLSVAVEALDKGMGSILMTVAPLLVATALTAIVGAVVQGGLHVSTKKLKPTFKQFDLAKGIKGKFGKKVLWEGLKATVKTAVVGMVLWTVVQGLVPLMLGSGSHSLRQIIAVAGGGASNLLRTAVVAGLVLAALDVVVIQRRNLKQTRMTKREIQDENKQSEGDPQLKGAIRSRQLAVSRNRMIAEVAHADVVLVNPTHVAVALRYDPGTGAPKVIAKGKGHVATRIREAAARSRVPMVEDVPLARALHSACKLGQEIPADLYVAVARILAFVMALRRRGGGTGIQRAPGGPTKIPVAA